MKNLLILSILIVTFSNYGQAQGLTKTLSNIQSETSEKVKQMLKQNDSENEPVPPKVSGSNNANFKPSPSENFKNIANEMGKTAEEKAMFLQVFTEVKKGFEVEAAKKGMKNNIAAAMTFLMATAVMVYHQSPEPSDAATERLFHGLNEMFDEMPEMSSALHKDKQFLYDLYLSYGGLILASYEEAKASSDKNSLDSVRVFASSMLLELFKINPNDLRFEGDTLIFKKAQTSNQSSQNIAPQKSVNSYGITKFTTTFDDGWVATPSADYVRVVKDDVEVRLYFPDARIDGRKPQNTNSFEPYYWDIFVKSAFNVKQVFIREKEQYSIGQSDNLEAAATDKQTGKNRYVGMGLTFFNGSCWTIVVNAPDKNTYYSMFPNDASLKKMLDYNKFGVAQQDLIGKWSSFNAASIEYYNIYTGDNVGMATASTNDSFVFNSNGTYQSEHAGTSTFRGSLGYGKTNYKGTFRVNDWNITASNREANDSGEFSCQFEAVKGGFTLSLVNKKFSGMNMKLFKVK